MSTAPAFLKKMPPGKPPNMKSPDKLLKYLRLLAHTKGYDASLVRVPGMEGHPVDGSIEFPGDLTPKQSAHFNSGGGLVKSAYSVTNLYTPPAPLIHLTDDEILTKIQSRFHTLHKISHAACKGEATSVVVSGRGGVGKTYTIKNIVQHYHEKEGTKYEIISGVVSPIHLFMALWRNRMKGAVTILDDADGVFDDPDALMILKKALDTDPVRELSWLTNSTALKNEGIDKQFLYEGSMIFLTNLNFRQKIAIGKGPMVEHLQALMTRAMYLDLKLHTNRELIIWIQHLVKKNHILKQIDLSEAQENMVLDFMVENQNQFDTLSIRSALLLGKCVKMDENNWQDLAFDLCMKE